VSKRSYFALCILTVLAIGSSTWAADHREAPLIREDPTADINDIYAFPSPNDPSKVVLAMTVNPFSVPAEAISYAFAPDVEYAFRIDTDGDGREERVIRVRFGEPGSDGQRFRVFLPDGRKFDGDATPPTEAVVPNDPIIVQGPSGVRAFAGPRDDPFFFDVVGFFRFLDGTGSFSGSDGFAGFNVSAIVLEVPLELVGAGEGTVGIWGTTGRSAVTLRAAPNRSLSRTFLGVDFPTQTNFGPSTQIERMGNPAVSTVLIPSGQKDIFNATQPRFDAQDFAGTLVASLQALGTPDDNIAVLASVAVPDTLKFDAAGPAGFPNGRGLPDDVIDVLLGLILGDPSIGDGVDANDVPFAQEFPFLAPPQQPL
jgi:hypothetical protein